MSQPNYLVPEGTPLYHASEHDFSPGDVVMPRGWGAAFATSDHTSAANFGSKVYEVEPVDRDEAEATTRYQFSKWASEPNQDNLNTVRSEKGFRVIQHHPALSNPQFKPNQGQN